MIDYGPRLHEKLGSSWLIQRLHAPSKGIGPLGIDNPFSFGGGLKNGGLSEDAMKLLRDIFSFDYMGSAEFEFGAVPSTFKFLAGQKLVAGEVKCDNFPVYFVCPEVYHGDVPARILALYKRDKSIRLQEYCGLHEKLNGAKYGERNLGWLELDNGFAFFADKGMFEKFCTLFGVEVSSNAQ